MSAKNGGKSRWDQPTKENTKDKEKFTLSQEYGLPVGQDEELSTKKQVKNDIIASGSKRSTAESTIEQKAPSFGIKMSCKQKHKEEPLVQKKKVALSSVFNDDSDSEEEMPLECRMKMRNIGRDTITSSGPKSYNKGKDGFCNNSFKQFELSMKPRNSMEKQNNYDT